MPSVSEIYAHSKKRTLTWLVLAGMAGVAWLVVWLTSTTPKSMQTTKSADITSQDLPLPKSIDVFREFAKEVPLVDLKTTVVRDMRNYPVEFKDRKFFEKHKNRWTVQVMDVAQNDIITGYLKGRNDRDKFTYFRYNGNNGVRYILTYGVMGSQQEAIGAVKTVDFGLPASVVPVPEKLGSYLGSIDKYERTEEIVDSSPNAPRKVKLQATRTEIPAVPRSPVKTSAPPKKETPRKETAQKEAVAPKKHTNQNTQNAQNRNERRAEQSREVREARERIKENREARERQREARQDNTERQKRQEEREEARQKAREKAREQRAERQAQQQETPKAPTKEPKRDASPVTETPKTPGSDL